MDVPLPVLQRVCRRARDRYGLEWTPAEANGVWAAFVAAVVPVLRGEGVRCPDDPGEFRAWLVRRPHLRLWLRQLVRDARRVR